MPWSNSRVTWNSRIWARRKIMKNRKSNIFSIGFICLEFPFVFSFISTVRESLAQIFFQMSCISSHVLRWRSPRTSFTSRFCWSSVSRGGNHQRYDASWITQSGPQSWSNLLDAFENAQFLCEGFYLRAPSLVLRTINGNSSDHRLLRHLSSILW